MEERLLKSAQKVYKTICEALDARNWSYANQAEDLMAVVEVTGEDLPIRFALQADADLEQIRIWSYLPSDFTEKTLVSGIVAVGQVNMVLKNGAFLVNTDNGEAMFKMTQSYKDSLITVDTIQYLIQATCKVVDDYNEKFMMLAKDMIDLQKFIDLI